MDRVNIIMASYNGENYIKEQIESIIRNEYKDWRLWIFDDGSSDATGNIINGCKERYPENIRYQKNDKNKGITRNFLEGLVFAAKQEDKNCQQYYMFCDQDDVWMPDKIKRTLKRMKGTEKKYGRLPAAVFTDAVVVDEKLRVISPSFHKESKLDTSKRDLNHILIENKLIGCTVMVNSALVDRMAILPKHARYHDWWVALIGAAFGHISYLPEPTLYYRQHSSNMVGNKSFPEYVKNRVSALNLQKDAIHQCILQAGDFYEIYHGELSRNEKKAVYAFANLEQQNWMERKLTVAKYGYWKTGLLRNLGVLLLV